MWKIKNYTYRILDQLFTNEMIVLKTSECNILNCFGSVISFCIFDFDVIEHNPLLCFTYIFKQYCLRRTSYEYLKGCF